MRRVVFTCICLFFANACLSQSFSVHLKILDTPSTSQVNFLATITNLGKETVYTVEEPLLGYYSDYWTPVGNLIIEIRCKKDTGFVRMNPVVHIDPVFYKKKIVNLLPGKSINQKFTLEGYYWAQNGFLPGDYTVRVYFNEEELGTSLNHKSNDTYFRIK